MSAGTYSTRSRRVQAGAGRLLAATDLTGSTPAQLATEKGHRFLAMYLHDAAQKHQRKQGCALLRGGMRHNKCHALCCVGMWRPMHCRKWQCLRIATSTYEIQGSLRTLQHAV